MKTVWPLRGVHETDLLAQRNLVGQRVSWIRSGQKLARGRSSEGRRAHFLPRAGTNKKYSRERAGDFAVVAGESWTRRRVYLAIATMGIYQGWPEMYGFHIFQGERVNARDRRGSSCYHREHPPWFSVETRGSTVAAFSRLPWPWKRCYFACASDSCETFEISKKIDPLPGPPKFSKSRQ